MELEGLNSDAVDVRRSGHMYKSSESDARIECFDFSSRHLVHFFLRRIFACFLEEICYFPLVSEELDVNVF